MPATLVSETQAVKTLDFKDLTRLVENKLEQLRSAKQTAEVRTAMRILTDVKARTVCRPEGPCGPTMEFPLLPID
jgi:hypothetical protein